MTILVYSDPPDGDTPRTVTIRVREEGTWNYVYLRLSLDRALALYESLGSVLAAHRAPDGKGKARDE